MATQTKYTKIGDVHIAYQVVGDGPIDLVVVPGWVKDIVAGSGLRFEERGTQVLKGVPGEWQLFSASAA